MARFLAGEMGFTLLELVIVMVLAGILFAAGADLIVGPFRNFTESESRMELYEEGQIALERIRAELYHAVPNAVYVSADNSTLTFGTVDSGYMESRGLYGRYLEDSFPVDNNITDVNGKTAAPGRVLSIYNVSWTTFSSGSRLFQVTGNSTGSMILDKNVPAGGYHRHSRRYYVVDGAVRFQYSGNYLYRSTASVTVSGIGGFGTSYPLSSHVKEGRFRFLPGNTRRNGVVVVEFVLEGDGGESVRFVEEVHLPNVP